MNVLLIGSGGREAALAWALARSPRLATLRCAPGNAGIARHAECVDLAADDVAGIVRHVEAAGYDLVVIGPEAPLVAGLADRLRERAIPVFGPSAAAAQIEGSKVFSKRFMTRHGLPTARYEVFTDLATARVHLESDAADYPLVIKADGLAAGKGVILAEDAHSAIAAAEGMLSGEDFGDAGVRILVEEMLRGREASFFVLSDGTRFVALATCQDYKRALDGDRGSNTGGMGTYSPSVYLDAPTRRSIVSSIVEPTIAGLAAEERPYRGVLYIGLMLTDEGPKVLEYNARFGDPETQALLPRLDGDWLELLDACARGELPENPPRWKPGASVCIVMTAGGYPGAYERGKQIEGLEEIEAREDVIAFHAGTARDASGRYVTDGGRVLGVTAMGLDIADARARAYAGVAQIHWTAERHRSDIALDAVGREEHQQ